jgi:hypothetical protein
MPMVCPCVFTAPIPFLCSFAFSSPVSRSYLLAEKGTNDGGGVVAEQQWQTKKVGRGYCREEEKKKQGIL